MSMKTRYVIEGENRTDRMFNEIDREIKRTDAAFMKFKGAALGVGAAVTAAFAFGSLALGPTREFEKLQASLETVTGSSENARKSMAWIEQFATETPFRLDEVVQAFLTLEARGLKPSADALRAYGDTAVSLGKGLDQYIEAVADAATGEFERLKEFGIIASSQGKEVQLEFRGMRTTIAKESDQIVDYLQELGKTEFAGGMTRQMTTLDGVSSNLGDSFDRLWRTLSEESGLTAATKSAASAMTALNNALAEGIQKSGVLKGSYEGLIKGLVDSIRGTDSERLAELLEEAGDIDKRIAKLQGSLSRTDLLTSERQRLTKALDELNRMKAEIEGLRLVTETGKGSPARPTRKSAGGGDKPIDEEAQEALERQVKAETKRIDEFTRDIAELNREFAREQDEVNQEIARNNDDLNRTLRERQQERLLDLEASLRTETETIDQEYADRLQLLNLAEAKGLQTTKDYAELRRMVEEDRTQQLADIREREAKEFEKSQAKMFEDLTRAVEGWGNDAANALIEFATGGKATIGDFVESVLKDLARMAAKKALVDPIFEAVTGAFEDAGSGEKKGSGKGFWGTLGNLAGSALGFLQGSRATGGPVVAGMPYLWREPGREGEVFVPSTSGTVQQGAGGMSLQVVVNNQTPAQVSVTRQSAIDSRDGLERLVVDIIDSRLSDGTFDRTMGQSYGARRNGVRR